MDNVIRVKSGISSKYAEKTLTRDITCIECILDLIDNSIDSAQQEILHLDGDTNSQGLPNSYQGYEISLGTKSGNLYIEDNCGGISKETIQNRLLVIGEEESKGKSIGYFGVGLKRSLLKLGSNYEIKSYTPISGHSIEFSIADLTNNEKALEAKRLEKTNKDKGTSIYISNLNPDSKLEIIDNAELWQKELKEELSIRYSIFISKGLTLKYNNIEIPAHCPSIKSHKNIKVQKEIIQLSSPEVNVEIESGLHTKYEIGEGSSFAKKNSELTKDYGWYFVCNDRVIKIACKEHEFGWKGRWHNEYYGFVGWVYFYGSAAELPWNTKKTDIDPNSVTFRKISPQLQNFADKFRSQNRAIRKSEKGGKDQPEFNLKEHSEEQKKDSIEIGKSSDSKQNSKNKDKISPVTPSPKRPNKPTKVEKSDRIESALIKLDNHKLIQIYNSICTLSLNTHPVLIAIGTWAFFESLSKLMGANDNTPFTSFIGSKVKDWYPNAKDRKKKYNKLITDISERGNLMKHSSDYYTIDGSQLAVDLNVLEDLIVKLIEHAAENEAQNQDD